MKKKPIKTDSANCFCDVYVADDMDAHLLEKDEKIKLLEMANKNGNYALMDKCDEFNEYVEKTKKTIYRLRERLTEIIQICVGYDGYNSEEGLKGLIDDIKDYAGKIVKGE